MAPLLDLLCPGNEPGAGGVATAVFGFVCCVLGVELLTFECCEARWSRLWSSCWLGVSSFLERLRADCASVRTLGVALQMCLGQGVTGVQKGHGFEVRAFLILRFSNDRGESAERLSDDGGAIM